MRIAIVNKDKCHPKQCSSECIKYCPRVRTGDETIEFDSSGKIKISEELCVGCGICVKKCYFNAIIIIGLPETLNEPIHRHGENGFTLFGLPIPKIGKVTGILGSNGIGKTTAIKILSGSLIPNFGKVNNTTKENVLNYFSGTQLYEHFKKLYNNQIKVSIKPQYIDQIPKYFKGTVLELFQKNNLNNNIFKNMIEDLNIKSLIDRNIESLSGGELQRVAIAICLSKDADIYFFDEISSYLDIYQRIHIAKVIKNFSKDKSVIVVEHDLALLDLLADSVHISYGKPSAYGVLTLPKSIRNGINQYINGYLSEENIRFRDEPIVFEDHPPKTDKDIKTIISYDEFIKKNGSFKLTAKCGNIKEGEVIGIVGQNGIGKTTFIKIIAGIINPDDHKINLKYKISYKPQYIKSDEKIKVKDYLLRINSSFVNSSYFDVELGSPMELENIYDLYLSDLSGGELQRVAIVGCLIKDADLYVIDEPSAHLDVNQRSKVTKIITRFTENNKKTTMVVDHDIYMIDMISYRLIVFDGTESVEGKASSPMNMVDGMNSFLSKLDITFRRDEETNRPRINNYLSRLDREQKEAKNYYYLKK